MIEILLSLALLLGPGDYDDVPLIDCVIFADGIKSHEQVMAECQEYAETYVWDEPVYDEPVTECWRAWQFGLVETCEASGNAYTVQDGDLSLWSISQKYGISFGALLDANPENPNLIRVGQTIALP